MRVVNLDCWLTRESLAITEQSHFYEVVGCDRLTEWRSKNGVGDDRDDDGGDDDDDEQERA